MSKRWKYAELYRNVIIESINILTCQSKKDHIYIHICPKYLWPHICYFKSMIFTCLNNSCHVSSQQTGHFRHFISTTLFLQNSPYDIHCVWNYTIALIDHILSCIKIKNRCCSRSLSFHTSPFNNVNAKSLWEMREYAQWLKWLNIRLVLTMSFQKTIPRHYLSH